MTASEAPDRGPRDRLDRDRLAAARLWAVGSQPYLATALFALCWVPVPGLGTFAVDPSWRVYVDPQRLADWTVPEVGAVLLHEVGHLVRDSAGRGQVVGAAATSATARAWNAATDAAINADLDVAGVVLPGDGGLRPHHLGGEAGMTAEELYQLARERLTRPLRISLGDCGSGVDGVARPWDAADAGGGIGAADAVLIRVEVAAAVRAAAARGTVPAGWERWAERQGSARVDWRRVLGRAVRGAVAEVSGQADYSYRRPSRRAAASPGVVLPAMRRPVPAVAIVVDTSGSVDDELLGAALGEVDGVLRSVGVAGGSVRLLSVDAAVARVQTVRRVTDVRLRGGGGTDLRVGLAAALALRPAPDVVVVLTDGDTPWPDRRPRAQVVVVLLDGARPVPSWCTAIVVGRRPGPGQPRKVGPPAAGRRPCAAGPRHPGAARRPASRRGGAVPYPTPRPPPPRPARGPRPPSPPPRPGCGPRPRATARRPRAADPSAGPRSGRARSRAAGRQPARGRHGRPRRGRGTGSAAPRPRGPGPGAGRPRQRRPPGTVGTPRPEPAGRARRRDRPPGGRAGSARLPSRTSRWVVPPQPIRTQSRPSRSASRRSVERRSRSRRAGGPPRRPGRAVSAASSCRATSGTGDRTRTWRRPSVPTRSTRSSAGIAVRSTGTAGVRGPRTT